MKLKKLVNENFIVGGNNLTKNSPSHAFAPQKKVAEEGKQNYSGRTFQTYAAWKRAVKQLDPDATFRGDKDIDSAYKKGHYDAEWDGESGGIQLMKEVSEKPKGKDLSHLPNPAKWGKPKVNETVNRDKDLLSERMLGFAGITETPSIGFTSNSPNQEVQEDQPLEEDDFNPQNFPTEEAFKNAEMTERYIRELNGPVPVAKQEVPDYQFEVYFQNGEIDDIEVVSGDFVPNISMTRQLINQGLPLGDAILSSKGRMSVNESRVGKPHEKGLISERAMGMLGLVSLQPIGIASNANLRPIKRITEVSSDLSRNELYKYLPMMHSSVLMELADNVLESSSGKKWNVIVEDLAEEYLCNPVAKQKINQQLKKVGAI